MRDKQGVLRGICSLCDCRDYTPPNSGFRCEFCNHTAPEHRPIELSTSVACTATPSNSESFDVDDAATIFKPWVVTIPHHTDLQSTAGLDFPRVTELREPEDEEDILPPNEDIGGDLDFDRTLVKALQKGEISADQELQLIRDVALHLKKKNRDKPKYLWKAAKQMHKRWNCVGSKVDLEQTGLHIQLRRRMERLRLREKKRSQNKENEPPAPIVADENFDVPVNEMTHEQCCLKIKTIYESDRPSKKAIEALLKATRDVRILEAQVRPLKDVLDTYPCLRNDTYLRSELFAILETNEHRVAQLWAENFPKLILYINQEKVGNIPDAASEDQKAIFVIYGLHMLFKKQKRPLLNIYEENTAVEETKPKGRVVGRRVPPYLIAIGDVLSPPISFHSFLEGEIMFATQNPKEAMYLLFAVYYVFQCKWCPTTRLQLLLLHALFLPLEKVRKEVTANAELKKILKSVGVPL